MKADGWVSNKVYRKIIPAINPRILNIRSFIIIFAHKMVVPRRNAYERWGLGR